MLANPWARKACLRAGSASILSIKNLVRNLFTAVPFLHRMHRRRSAYKITITRHLTILIVSGLLVQFVQIGSATAFIQVGGTEEANQWSFKRAKEEAEKQDIWKILGDAQGGVDKTEVMKFLWFAATSKTIIFNFDDAKQFKDAIISITTANYIPKFSKIQHIIKTQKGIKKYFENPTFITPRLKGQSGSAGKRDLLKKDRDILFDIAGLLVKKVEDGGESLRLFRTMNCDGANFLKAHEGALKTLASKIAKNKDYLLSNEDNDLLDEEADEKGLHGHYGDVFQASTYLRIPLKGAPSNCLVEFKLKPASHLVLFGPNVVALTGAHKSLATTPMGQALERAYGGFKDATGQDGFVPGWLGIKHEARGDFSFSVGKNKSTKLLFLLFVESITVHSYETAEKTPMVAAKTCI